MVNNVAYELFGDVADKHEEVRNVCLKFAAKNWIAVKGSSAFSAVKNEARDGKRSTTDTNTLFELASIA